MYRAALTKFTDDESKFSFIGANLNTFSPTPLNNQAQICIENTKLLKVIYALSNDYQIRTTVNINTCTFRVNYSHRMINS
ncbi:MAG TPA: hypothetical protein DCR43_05705 [Bacteroidales bacterium]|nr:MAG: hypothetical protein A2X11_12155 [Bacteroidetes bacterium GWE2_42_24]OFY32441.1 MAG: hypothetical protein A2X09_07900 [Bacteroidetes bacterium GWF2_43_11]HAQ65330.1 hypothetical protein [Bacteroidales bacterium]HBZ65445.1 hypothetical protein [Bacteroidales bacterium]